MQKTYTIHGSKYIFSIEVKKAGDRGEVMGMTIDSIANTNFTNEGLQNRLVCVRSDLLRSYPSNGDFIFDYFISYMNFDDDQHEQRKEKNDIRNRLVRSLK